MNTPALEFHRYHQIQPDKEHNMTICPIAVVASCKQCPVVKVCLLKTVLGDYPAQSDQPHDAEEKPEESKTETES